jgi:F420-dependent oxidoreductase-like protein
MKIGLQIPSFTWPGGAENISAKLAEIARTADTAGFFSLWVMDHLFQIRGVGPVENEMLESYSTLSYLAGQTEHARLGTMVTGVVYRHPGILVKEVTTLDVLSKGRAYLGIGAAWNDVEANSLGIPFPPLKERFERLEETLQIAKQMWSGNEEAFEGKYYHLTRPLNSPQPLTKPHPPILVGGMGEKKTLLLVAKYADACNIFARMGLDIVKAKFDILKSHCEKIGRDYSEIEKTTLNTVEIAPGQMTAAQVIDECRAQAKIGVQQMIFNMPNVHEIRPLEIFGKEIIPAAAGL